MKCPLPLCLVAECRHARVALVTAGTMTEEAGGGALDQYSSLHTDQPHKT